MRRTILVADSDPRTARSLRVALEPQGFAVVEDPDPISLLTLLLWIPVALVVVNPHPSDFRCLSSTAFRLLRCLGREGSPARPPAVMFADASAPKLATRIRALTRHERIGTIHKVHPTGSTHVRIARVSRH